MARRGESKFVVKHSGPGADRWNALKRFRLRTDGTEAPTPPCRATFERGINFKRERRIRRGWTKRDGFAAKETRWATICASDDERKKRTGDSSSVPSCDFPWLDSSSRCLCHLFIVLSRIVYYMFLRRKITSGTVRCDDRDTFWKFLTKFAATSGGKETRIVFRVTRKD